MSMYGQFGTSADLERDGVDVDYGDFMVRIARAGGSNRRFARLLEEKMKPYRRAMQTGSMDNARAEAVMRETYAESVVLLWSVRVVADEKGKPVSPVQLASAYRAEHGKDPASTVLIKGIEGPDGDILEATPENIAEAFRALPDLFADIRDQASKVALFRQESQKEDAGN